MTAPAMTPRERIEGAIGRALLRLPLPVQRLLVGRPTRLDGLELHPTSQLLILLERLSGGTPIEELPVERARAQTDAQARAVGEPRAPVARVEEVEVPGAVGPLAGRLYVPEEAAGAGGAAGPDAPSGGGAGSAPGGAAGPGGLLVYYHGGGHVIGGLESHDPACRFISWASGVRVLAVDYRLAPEHPFPAAVEDALATLRFAFEYAERLGADPRRIAVGGDSAGGNLAAVAALAARAGEAPEPAFQLLVYPLTDYSRKRRSYELFGDGFLLSDAEMDWFREHYLRDPDAARDWRASPLLAQDLSGLPPAYVMTAGFDPLRDEGEEYAAALLAAGVPTVLRRHDGLLHSFVNQTAVNRPARDAMLEAAGALRLALAPRG